MINSETKRLIMGLKKGGEFGLDEEEPSEEIQEIEEPFSGDDDEGKSEY